MQIRFKLTQLSPVILSGLLFGCASTPAQVANAEATVKVPSHELQATPVAAKPLTGQTFFELLLAEIAINRGDLGSAASIYGLVSEHESDPAVFERAIALNQSIGNYKAVSALADRWVAIEPNSAGPWQALTVAAMNTGDFDNAIVALKRWLAVDPEADVSIALPHSRQLTQANASELNTALVELIPSYPKSHALYFAHARLSSLLDSQDNAEGAIQKAIKLKPELTYQLFQYQTFIKDHKVKPATVLIESLIKRHPTNPQVGVTYARHLYRFDRTNLKQLRILHSRFAGEPVIARTFARVAFEQNELDEATAMFQHLLDQGFEDEGHYFLGIINLQNNLPDAAQIHFSQVTAAPYLASALSEWARMGDSASHSKLIIALDSARTVDPDQVDLYWKIQASLEHELGNDHAAIDVYSQALKEQPDNTLYLYEQALLYAYIDNYDALESNLAKVLTLEPENINAMNALGYTWADLDKNLEQATLYIDRALNDQPDNPAFMDSKGWLLYRQGDVSEALSWLSKAYQQLENDEVAAHLAEVLWALNETDEAQKYYQKVIELNPQSPFIEKLEQLFND
ncbi:tetratricopeptide repeat protein [Reinekea sp.]|jgi:tetratricopeptide (TPR) repeat protein|uniref:tetratricopeptide repeat protein n=1 Tax=Reinekea sp. TaxID=1970455 RepID=UPI00398A37F8